MARYGSKAWRDEHADQAQMKQKYAREIVRQLKEIDFDYVVVPSYKEWFYKKECLYCPEESMAFAKECLRKAGYHGPFAIVVHNKHGRANWHPHILIVNRRGFGNAVQRVFFPIADLGLKKNGPIRDKDGVYHYFAYASVESWPDADKTVIDPRWHRRPRQRGRRRPSGRCAIAVNIAPDSPNEQTPPCESGSSTPITKRILPL